MMETEPQDLAPQKRKASSSPAPEDAVAAKRTKLEDENVQDKVRETVDGEAKPENGKTEEPAKESTEEPVNTTKENQAESNTKDEDRPMETDAVARADETTVQSPVSARGESDAQREQARPPSQKALISPEQSRKNVSMEEKKRGRRLFGGLLNTLSQTAPNKAQQNRRKEMERRQQERVQQQRVEDDRRRTDLLAERRRFRDAKQVDFEERMMHRRHEKMLVLAHSLRTVSEPVVYYKPWELTKEQERIIDEQICEAEETIAREVRQFEAKHGRPPKTQVKVEPRTKSPPPSNHADEGARKEQDQVGEQPNKSSEDANHGADPSLPSDGMPPPTAAATVPPSTTMGDDKGVTAASIDTTIHGHDHDHDGDEMIQDGEDMVIY
ncbi:pinin/SDK/memA/ protein conserved region-domain-containing protein [Sordaria brevicollis]|uniref:Pinin/SDK/memA/ protein conserved region-domain-containing protein n=1 Tax=Sordaria brevicollis TaxID=83679 RepID=A0AAE0P231_SORBR|nr:pinin/SDK/memA/ protein conserved region-domain-containing protein [Sordaria brevicollis]